MAPATRISRAVLALALLAVSCGSSSEDQADAVPAQTEAAPTTPTTTTTPPTTTAPPDPVLSEPPPDLGAVPELTDISAWLNTDGSSFEEVRGEVTIVQFWTFGCYNCKNTLPHLQSIYASHREAGVEIIGVHAHEFDYERDPDNVAQAVIDLGVTWPVALDTDKTNFRSWQGSPRYWPRTYVIDQDGRIRFDHIGEGDYEELEATVAHLLAEGA